MPSFISRFLLILVLASTSICEPSIAATAVRPHVIGAGLGRTGTTSFKAALEVLGLGPIFHMRHAAETASQKGPLWDQLAKLTPVPILPNGDPVWPPRFSDRDSPLEQNHRVVLIQSILGRSNSTIEEGTAYQWHSTVDFPLCLHFLDILDAYKTTNEHQLPIKVVLTSRDTGETWAKSMLNTILNWHPSRRKLGQWIVVSLFLGKEIEAMFHNTNFRYFSSSVEDNQIDQLSEMHDSWNDYVRVSMADFARRKSIPLQNIFLDFNVKQGWKPLCDFLEVPAGECPSEPFPHMNDTEAIKKSILITNLVGYATLVMMFGGLVLFLAFLIRKYHGKKKRKQS